MSASFSVGSIALPEVKWGVWGAAVIQFHFLFFTSIKLKSSAALLLDISLSRCRVKHRLKQDFIFLFSLQQVNYFLTAFTWVERHEKAWCSQAMKSSKITRKHHSMKQLDSVCSRLSEITDQSLS